jgi:hypothetical protein
MVYPELFNDSEYATGNNEIIEGSTDVYDKSSNAFGNQCYLSSPSNRTIEQQYEVSKKGLFANNTTTNEEKELLCDSRKPTRETFKFEDFDSVKSVSSFANADTLSNKASVEENTKSSKLSHCSDNDCSSSSSSQATKVEQHNQEKP